MKLFKSNPFQQISQKRWLNTLASVPPNLDVVVHIGLPKTGSSVIQRYCLQNRDTLERNGFYYPEHLLEATGISAGHAKLQAAILTGNPNPIDMFEQFLSEAKTRQCTLLLSSETFWALPSQIESLVRGKEYAIVAMVRHPFDILVSSYNQYVKRQFLSADLQSFLKNAAKNQSHGFSGSLLNEWAKTIPATRLIANPYYKAQILKFGAIPMFRQILGIPVKRNEKIPVNDRLNSSYTPEILELKRMLNLVLDKDTKKKNYEIDLVLQKASDNYFSQRNKSDADDCIEITEEAMHLLETGFASAVDAANAVLTQKLKTELRVCSTIQEQLSMRQAAKLLYKRKHVVQYIRTRIDEFQKNIKDLPPAQKKIVNQLNNLFPSRN